MLGKNIRIEIFGTLAEGKLYSGFIISRHSTEFRQVYIMTDVPLEGVADCTVIALATIQPSGQVRLIAAPRGKILYEPDIRTRLMCTSVRIKKLVCMYEKSCGAVVYRRIGGGHVRILLVKNHNGKSWPFPKGHVEVNETEKETALREIKEETGLAVEIEPNFRRTSIYRPFGKTKKQVVFFLARAHQGTVSLQKDEIDSFMWVTIDKAMTLCKHKNDTRILLEVKRRLCG